MKNFILLFIALLLTNCGGPSFHSSYERVIVAQIVNENTPASNYPFRIIYHYDHYGVFYFWNAPSAVEGNLDQDGKVVVKIADFFDPHLVIGSSIFGLNKDIITNGGELRPFVYLNNDKDYQRHREFYTPYNLPEERLPEVKLIISK